MTYIGNYQLSTYGIGYLSPESDDIQEREGYETCSRSRVKAGRNP